MQIADIFSIKINLNKITFLFDGISYSISIRNTLLPKLPDNALIVIDNASYHTRQEPENKCPTTSTRKADMHRWLNKHSMFFMTHTVQ